jgi:uncharacterized membrane protein YccC
MQRPEVLNQVAPRLNQAGRWRDLISFDKGKLAPEIAARNTIGILIPLIAGAALGNASAGAVGALGALGVSYRDNRDPYAARARRMLLASVLLGLAVSLGAIAGRNNILIVAVATLWAFGTGMMVLFGLQAGNLGVTTVVTLVVFAARHLTPIEALEAGLVAAAGGVLQTLLSIAFWPVHRYEPERRIIGSLYRSLADLAVSPAGVGGAPPGTAQLAETQKVLTSLARDRSLEAERYIFLVTQAERIRLSLLTLRRLLHRIGRDPQGSGAAAITERILIASSGALEEMSRGAIGGIKPVSLEGFNGAVEQFGQLDWKSPSPFLAATIRDTSHQIDALAGQLRTARSLISVLVPEPVPGLPTPDVSMKSPADLKAPLAVLRANLSLQSTAFRHAVRLAVSVGAGEALAHSLNIQRSYWLTMTIAIVLRPYFTATFNRGILRIAGTIAGLLLATGLFHFLPTGRTSEIALLAVFAFLLRWIGPANYGVFVTAVSALIVLLLAITGTSPGAVIMARAVNTVVGGVIALAAYWIWPTWERTRAGPILADLVDAYRNYLHAVLDAYITGAEDEAERDSTRMKARLARSNAEALIDRIGAEPGSTTERTNLLNGMLASAHNFVRAVMALESDLDGNRPERVRPATIEFALKVEATLRSIGESLRTSTSLPRLPDLRAAHNAILASTEAASDQYTLINTETDRITTSLNTLSEQAARLPR